MKHLLYRKMLKMQIGSCHSDISEGTILDMMSQLSSVGFEVVMAYPSFLGEFMVKNCVVDIIELRISAPQVDAII